MLFLKEFILPGESYEIEYIKNERRTCFNTMYPFNIFPVKGLDRLEFSPVTVFYGGNGSGKTTLLNVIGEKCRVIRHSEFNNSPFFEKFVSFCMDFDAEIPETSQFLSSDDVFDYVLNIRYLNDDIDNHRENLFKGYALMRERARNDESYTKLHGLVYHPYTLYHKTQKSITAMLFRQTEAARISCRHILYINFQQSRCISS